MPLMFLNGGAMRGGPLHHLLRGAALVAEVRTAPRYRFYSVGDRFPALENIQDPNITGPSKRSGAGADVGVGVGASASDGGDDGIGAIGRIGVGVRGELYDVPWEVLRESLLPAEPDELELGVIELEDGSGALSMVRRRTYVEPEGLYRDISGHANWRGYTTSLAASAGE